MHGLIVSVTMLICDVWPYSTHPVSHDSILHRMVALHALIMAWHTSRWAFWAAQGSQMCSFGAAMWLHRLGDAIMT